MKQRECSTAVALMDDQPLDSTPVFLPSLFLRVVREIPDDLGILKTHFSRNKSGNKEIIIYKRAIFSVAYGTLLFYVMDSSCNASRGSNDL